MIGAETSKRVLVGTLDQIKSKKKAPIARAAVPTLESRNLALQLATARWIENSLTNGCIPDAREAARVLGVTVARVSQLLDLLLLSPVIQQAVCEGEGVAMRFGAHQVRRLASHFAWAEQEFEWDALVRRFRR